MLGHARTVRVSSVLAPFPCEQLLEVSHHSNSRYTPKYREATDLIHGPLMIPQTMDSSLDQAAGSDLL